MKSITCFTLAYMMGCVGRGKFYAAMISVCGDWPWLADSGFFERSYRCVMEKRTKEKQLAFVTSAQQVKTVILKKSIHLPLNGLGTMYTLGLSHADADESPFGGLCHTFPGQLAQLWSYDLFHTMHLGVCKAFLGSALALLSEYQPETSVDLRFQSLTDLYLCWTHQNGPQALGTENSQRNCWDGTSTTMYPNGTWHKGALSTTLMTWVESRFDAEGHLWGPGAAASGRNLQTLQCFF